MAQKRLHSAYENPPISHVMTPTSEEKAQKKLRLIYYPVRDAYDRQFGGETAKPGSSPTVSVSWDSMVNAKDNLDLKVEHDWAMTYLAREPGRGHESGVLSWKIDLRRKKWRKELLIF